VGVSLHPGVGYKASNICRLVFHYVKIKIIELNPQPICENMVDVMDRKIMMPAFTTLIIATATVIYSQGAKEPEKKDILLSDIAANIASYKAKTVTLRLRLKYVDRTFERITFYDRKNHDIEFDISSRRVKKRIAADMRDLHEGMEYFVTFTVEKIDGAGGIIAELQGFKPVILEYMP
jgi:hypothetical protein